MERKNGFLDLDLYFKDKDKSDIVKSEYWTGHFWLMINNEKYYFKPTNYCYKELLAYYIAKHLGYNALYYDLAIFKGEKGVISKDYKKANCKYYSGIDILKKYYEKFPEELTEMGLLEDWKKRYEGPYIADMNNLEIIWQATEFFFSHKQNFDISMLMEEFIGLYIFCVLIRSYDAGPYNWVLEESENKVKLVPFFDNGASFDSYSSAALSTSFSDNERYQKTSIKTFLKISSKEFVEQFIEKYNMFDMNLLNTAITDVEKQIGTNIPKIILDDIYHNFILNKTEIEEVLIDLNLKNKGR